MTLLMSWHPVTSDFGLINAPVDQVVDAIESWQIAIGLEHSRRSVDTSLASAFEALLPLSADMRRRLFMTTAAGWTAAFQSGIQGSDPFPAMSYLAQRMGVLAMRVCASPPDARYPAVMWEVYAPPSLGGDGAGYRRTIAAANDASKWVFTQSGEPFPFESTELYSARRKRDRFPHELLARYLKEFGLEPFADEFYVVSPLHQAVILERKRDRSRGTPEFTLADVVSGKPWHRD